MRIDLSAAFNRVNLLGILYSVKNYRRGIADFLGVILLKRRRIAGEVSTLWA